MLDNDKNGENFILSSRVNFPIEHAENYNVSINIFYYKFLKN